MIKKKINILLFIVGLLFIGMNSINAQTFSVPMNFSDGTGAIFNGTVAFGVDPLATDGYDGLPFEDALPPYSPGLEVRFNIGVIQSYTNIQNATGYPYSGSKTYTLAWQLSAGSTGLTYDYNLPAGVSVVISILGSPGPALTGAGTYLLPNSQFVTQGSVDVTYNNVAPALPIFSISPASPLAMPDAIANATTSNENVTVSNAGSVALNISNITSSNPEFTFSPSAFPVSIPVGGNQVFALTFTPTSVGNKTTNLVFTHNAAGSPLTYIVSANALAPSPIFSVTPASVNFGSVIVGSPSTQPVTITNTGTLQLDITGISSNNSQFTFTPNTFPINIAPGANSVINATFIPTSLGLQSGSLTFTHNAAGSPSNYSLQGTGADAVGFSASPNPVNFGTVNQPQSSIEQLTITNTGINTNLQISNIVSSNSQFTFAPNTFPINIAPGANSVINVTYTPTGGTVNATLTFTSNVGNSVVNLDGNSPSISGLIFKYAEQTRREDDIYVDTLQLQNISTVNGPIQALQFKLLVNAVVAEDTILKFISLTKGTDVSNSNWILDYNLEPGAGTLGASVDTIYAVLYNLNPSDSSLNLSTHSDLFRVTYRVVDLPASKDSAFSTFRLLNAFASSQDGSPIVVTPNPTDLKINVWNRVSANALGDVNGDGTIDILDLINVVDHIVSRDSLDRNITPGLTTSEFFRANIAPWGNIDSVVNVQDLALIQDIILNGQYPNGNPINKAVVLANTEINSLNKVNNSTATVRFYITTEGIAVKTISALGIRGAQLEFGSVDESTSNMIIDSKLGGGFYNQINELLKVLLYDPSGNIAINAGENLIANIPFVIENPQDISIDNIVIVDINKEKFSNISVEIYYNNAPDIPVDYSLSQNFPNPFNPSTSVNFSVPTTGLVTLKVYDMIGQEVATLFSGNAERGTYTLVWNGKDNSGNFVSSGSYVYRMSANSGEFIQSKKMIFLK